jgi:1-acyl-sn-glycerol-3-phosphate acyltransferase
MEDQRDEWGFNQEVLDRVQPILMFLYDHYWRIEANGLENVPDTGRALLVSNHSGQYPFDGMMLGMAILNKHPAKRLIRSLYGTWFRTLPFISTFLTNVGQTLALEENGTRLLEQEHLVAVFPEGIKGIMKLYRDRYRLVRFGRGGFIRMALKAQAPIIPVSVVGAEETYIALAKIPGAEKLFGYPLPAITPTWPWLGLLGLIPMPTKWTIDIGEPIPTSGYPPKAAENLILVDQLSDQVRNTIQQMVNRRLEKRRSIFFG